MPEERTIELGQVREMAEAFCTLEEIATEMGFEAELFQSRPELLAAWRRGRNTAGMNLRKMLWEMARGGDKTILTFLAKNELGYQSNPRPREANDEAVQQGNRQMAALAELINCPMPERLMEDLEDPDDEDEGYAD